MSTEGKENHCKCKEDIFSKIIEQKFSTSKKAVTIQVQDDYRADQKINSLQHTIVKTLMIQKTTKGIESCMEEWPITYRGNS